MDSMLSFGIQRELGEPFALLLEPARLQRIVSSAAAAPKTKF